MLYRPIFTEIEALAIRRRWRLADYAYQQERERAEFDYKESKRRAEFLFEQDLGRANEQHRIDRDYVDDLQTAIERMKADGLETYL